MSKKDRTSRKRARRERYAILKAIRRTMKNDPLARRRRRDRCALAKRGKLQASDALFRQMSGAVIGRSMGLLGSVQ